jgi:hypothetical protein
MPSSSPTALRVFHSAVPVLAAFVLAAAVVHAGWIGLVSASLGMVGTAVFLYGTWVVVKFAGASAQAGHLSRSQTVVMVVALLMKLPLVYVGWVVSNGLGPFGPTWFLAGLALVYSVVIWRAVLAVRD